MSKNEDPQNPSRRSFFRASAGYVAAGVTGGFLGAMGEKPVKLLVEPLIDNWVPSNLGVGDAYRALLSDNLPSVAQPGVYNPREVFKNNAEKAPSQYIKRSMVRVTDALCETYVDYEPEMCEQPMYSDVVHSGSAIFLGGPYSNPSLGNYLGYDMSARDSANPQIHLPRLKRTSWLRYGVVYGETTAGEFGGKVQKALRFEDGKTVERPQYAVYDYTTSRMLRADIDSRGFIEKEYFQIIRSVEPDGSIKLFFFGLHGHSLLGFFGKQGFRENLNKLLDAIDLSRTVQVLLPTGYETRKAFASGGRSYSYTHATPIWEDVKLHYL